MRSIRTKITFITVFAIVIVMLVASVSGVIAIRRIAIKNANDSMLLLCESGKKNLDKYFQSVEQSVEMVSAYIESDLDGVDDAHLQAHLDRASDIFKKLTYKTNGVLTYYYRIDPTVSENAKGFWYVNLDGEGFVEHEVTDISKYDTEDTGKLVWFTVPKSTGKPVWLPPYITDNLDVRVISYNVPVYFENNFVGVIGIEIDYSTMAQQVNNISLYKNGYAFISDDTGKIMYHPKMDVTKMKYLPSVPKGLVSKETMTEYEYNGDKKQAVWKDLKNGMRLYVSVPVKEINADWTRWSMDIVIAFIVLLIIFIIMIMRFSGHITKPLRKLTEAAERVNNGDYHYTHTYEGTDEVALLSKTFKKLTDHLKVYIKDLNNLAYADSLTSLHNKGAFDICVRDIDNELDDKNSRPKFAVCIFDCNDLKAVNDQNGHDKGDIYLKEAAGVICEVFKHSPVFRIGGDEFAVILIGRDFELREELLKSFDEICAGPRTTANIRWKQVDVARGMAVYDPNEDRSVSDVVRRADKLMYENKWLIKEKRAKENNQG